MAQRTILLTTSIATGLALGYYKRDYIYKIFTDGVSSIGTAIYDYLFPEPKPTGDILVGTGVIVRKGEYILLGKRLNSTGSGLFACPGGRLEYGESFLTAGLRELYEETGIKVQHPLQGREAPYVFPSTQDKEAHKPVFVVSPTKGTIASPSAFEGGFINVLCPLERAQMLVRYVICDLPDNQTPVLVEPEKCSGWFWCKWSDIVTLAHFNERLSLPDGITQDTFCTQAMVTKQQGASPVETGLLPYTPENTTNTTISTTSTTLVASQSGPSAPSKLDIMKQQTPPPPCYECTSQGIVSNDNTTTTCTHHHHHHSNKDKTDMITVSQPQTTIDDNIDDDEYAMVNSTHPLMSSTASTSSVTGGCDANDANNSIANNSIANNNINSNTTAHTMPPLPSLPLQSSQPHTQLQIPRLSPGCVLRPGIDRLFAPVHFLALTGFNPLTAQPE